MNSETEPHIRLHNVGFSYPSRTSPVLSGLDLTIAAGEFFVLLGPSGCGKTSVLDLVAGFEVPNGGTVKVGERPVRGPGRDRVVIFQGDDSLLAWLTAAQNVEFGLKLAGIAKAERRSRTREALKLVGMGEQGDKRPHELSGGMKQRVQIARALVSDAAVLLMDEPFGALDAQTRTSLQDELARICEQSRRTVLFITHDISEALILGDRIGVMTNGPAAQLRTVLNNGLARPRHRGVPEFAEMYGRIEQLIGAEAKAGVSESAVTNSGPVKVVQT